MNSQTRYITLANEIKYWAKSLGFQDIGICEADVSSEKPRLEAWLDKEYHGSMKWIKEHQDLRVAPQKLVLGTTKVISARMDYLPPDTKLIKVLKSADTAYVSRYALGRDYHKLIRKRLSVIAENIRKYCLANNLGDEISQRAFVDSAPVLERPLAAMAGLGWVGKHTVLINAQAGSWFFLGEIYTNLPLPVSLKQEKNQCGDCQACIQVCPTDAFPKPYVLDARRCISYLTIENKGPIPEEFREVMGNRVFGCDDCQAICPWNKYAKFTEEKDFYPRHNLENSDILTLFNWSEEEFLQKTAGSPIRRIGHENWLRNLSVALGNANQSPEIVNAIELRKSKSNNSWLIEHFDWALSRQKNPPKSRRRKLKRQ